MSSYATPLRDQAVAGTPPKEPFIHQIAEHLDRSGDIVQVVRELFSEILEIPVKEIEPCSTMDDLGIDSLLVTEVLAEIDKRFHVRIGQAVFQDCADVLSLGRCIESTTANQTSQTLNVKSTGKPSVKHRLDSTRSCNTNSNDENEHTGASLAAVSRDCFLREKVSYDLHSVTTGFAGFCTEVLPLQTELVRQYGIAAFKAQGLDLYEMKAGEEVVLKDCDAKHKQLIQQLYKILEDAGMVQLSDGRLPRRTTKSAPAIPAHVLYSRMLERFPQLASETKLLHSTSHRLADCLKGEADPLALIFGDSAARALLEYVYTNAPMFKTGTLLLAQHLSAVLEGFGGGREVKILELGAGTGGTTKHLVETLAALGSKCPFSYTLTDLSSSLVTAARRKFANGLSCSRQFGISNSRRSLSS